MPSVKQLIHGSILINDQGEIDRPSSTLKAPVETREPYYPSNAADHVQCRIVTSPNRGTTDSSGDRPYSQANDQSTVPWVNPYWTNIDTIQVPSTFTPTTSNPSHRKLPGGHAHGSLPSFYQPIYSPLTVPSLSVTNISSSNEHSSYIIPNSSDALSHSLPPSINSNGFTFTQLDLDTIQHALRLLETHPEALRTIASPLHVTDQPRGPLSVQMPLFLDTATNRLLLPRSGYPKGPIRALLKRQQVVLV